MKKKSNAFLIRLVLTNTLLLGLVGVYIVASIFTSVPMSRLAYVVLLAILAFINLLFMFSLWRKRAQLSLLAKIMGILWGWFIFWFWIFSPPYFLLVMNVDTLQLRWATFAFTWEVLSLGASYVTLCYLFFKPLQKYIETKGRGGEISKEESGHLYRRAVQYPSFAAFLILGFAAFGYAMGAGQEGFFALLPVIEGIKNYAIGFVASIFLAVIYYVTLRSLLDPLCSELEDRAAIEKRARSSIAQRVLLVSVMVVIGSLFLLQLIVVKSFQNIVRDEVAATLNGDITNGQWNTDIQTHGTILANPDEASLTHFSVSPENQRALANRTSGVIDDFQSQLKLVGFFTNPATGEKSVAVVPLDNYYGPLGRTIFSFLIGAFFVLFVGLGIAAIAAFALTRSIQILIKAIRNLDKNPKAAIPQIASGDEIEELSEALGFFVRQSQRLDQEKDEFISIASHHLRTPVTELLWLLTALEKGDPRENILTYLPDIKMSAAHMAELVKLLLDVHRFDETGRSGAIEGCELVGFVKSAIEKFEPHARRKSIKIELKAPEYLAIHTELVFLNIIVESLLSNAVEYTPEHGHIEIELLDEGSNVKMLFADSGIGIAEEDKEHIFDKFMRASNARAVKPNGTGLGLYIAKQSVLRLGGTISFTSMLGKGTTLEVIMPKTVSRPVPQSR